jgi:hypothetical protein
VFCLQGSISLTDKQTEVKGKEDDKNRRQLDVRIQGRQPGTQKGVIVGDKKR